MSVLQSITTTNVKKFTENESVVAQASLLLKPDGRILTDLTIIKPLIYSNGSLVIEDGYLLLKAPQSAISKLVGHLNKYCFKRKAELGEVDQEFDHVFVYVA